MSEVSPAATDAIEAVKFESIILETDRFTAPNNMIEISASVTNVDIFEHLDKPYLTGAMGFADTEDVVSSADIGGGEKVHIKLKSTRPDTKIVSKTFYIDKIVASNKTNENTEFFVFHLIEDVAYISNLQNVNLSYSGTPSEIIEKISQGFLGTKEIESTKSSQNIKVIVPNLNPLEAMSWIKNRACTTKGYPFYLMSTLAGDKLSFVDLNTLMSAPSLNSDMPYTYAESLMSEGNPLSPSHRRTILEYRFNQAEDLFSIIQKGLIGAEYRYIDPTQNKDNHFEFDVQSDVIDVLESDGIVKNKHSSLFSDKYSVEGKTFNKHKSKSISQVGSTSAYDGKNSYMQGKDKAHYKLNVINRSIDQLLKKNPLTITVNGVDFLDGTSHHTIGRNISVRFLRNLPAAETDYVYDNKKSGDFLIFSAKHSFGGDTYTVSLSCLKLSNGDVK